jgi:hypothetical protein
MMIGRGKLKKFGENLTPVPLHPPRIAYEVNWDGTRRSAVTSQRKMEVNLHTCISVRLWSIFHTYYTHQNCRTSKRRGDTLQDV